MMCPRMKERREFLPRYVFSHTQQPKKPIPTFLPNFIAWCAQSYWSSAYFFGLCFLLILQPTFFLF